MKFEEENDGGGGITANIGIEGKTKEGNRNEMFAD